MASQSVIAPSKIGPYSLRGTVGEGAFSIVKLVYNEELSVYFACKIVPKMRLLKGNLQERFESEIRINQQMHHAGVVQIVDVLKDDFNYYVIMEFCPNGDLFQYIIDRSRLQENEAKPFIIQILDALRYLHQMGVAHRDMKPENILVDSQGRLKLSDFGLSKFVDSKSGLVSTPCGSPCYASPECVSGHPYDGRKSDMWSMGVIVYAMLTAQLPWTKRNQVQLFDQIKKGDYKIPGYLSLDASDCIRGLMCIDLDKRLTIEKALNHPFLHGAQGLDRALQCPSRLINIRRIDRLFDRDTESLEKILPVSFRFYRAPTFEEKDFAKATKRISKKVPHVHNKLMNPATPQPVIELTPSQKTLPPTPLEMIANARKRLSQKPVSMASIPRLGTKAGIQVAQSLKLQANSPEIFKVTTTSTTTVASMKNPHVQIKPSKSNFMPPLWQKITAV